MWTRQGKSTQSILRSIIHHERGTVESQPWHRRDVTTPRSQNVWQILNVSTILISQLTTLSLLCIQPVVFTINTELIAVTPSFLHISLYTINTSTELIANISIRIDCSDSFLPAHFSIYHQYQYRIDCKYQYKNWLQWLLPSCTSQYIPSIPVKNWLLQVFPSCTLSV